MDTLEWRYAEWTGNFTTAQANRDEIIKKNHKIGKRTHGSEGKKTTRHLWIGQGENHTRGIEQYLLDHIQLGVPSTSECSTLYELKEYAPQGNLMFPKDSSWQECSHDGIS